MFADLREVPAVKGQVGEGAKMAKSADPQTCRDHTSKLYRLLAGVMASLTLSGSPMLAAVAGAFACRLADI